MLPTALALRFVAPFGGPSPTRFSNSAAGIRGRNVLITESGTVVRRNRDD